MYWKKIPDSKEGISSGNYFTKITNLVITFAKHMLHSAIMCTVVVNVVATESARDLYQDTSLSLISAKFTQLSIRHVIEARLYTLLGLLSWK